MWTSLLLIGFSILNGETQFLFVKNAWILLLQYLRWIEGVFIKMLITQYSALKPADKCALFDDRDCIEFYRTFDDYQSLNLMRKIFKDFSERMCNKRSKKFYRKFCWQDIDRFSDMAFFYLWMILTC